MDDTSLIIQTISHTHAGLGIIQNACAKVVQLSAESESRTRMEESQRQQAELSQQHAQQAMVRKHHATLNVWSILSSES